MDYKKLYTPTEATALYNVAKIKFDPTAYSLKGNLITNYGLDSLRKEHIVSFGYKAEDRLLELIRTNEKLRPNNKVFCGMSGIEVPYRDFSHGIWSALSVQQDNLHISLELLAKLVDLRSVKGTNIMQTIVTLCVALNSSKSCSKDLLWLALGDTYNDSYEDVHTFERIKNALSKRTSSIQIVHRATTVDCTYVPADDEFERIACTEPFKIDPTIATDTLYSYLINSFELLWAWKALPDSYKDCFIELCNRAQKATMFDTEFFKPYFEFTGTGFTILPAVDAAISIENPKERYEAYQSILLKMSKAMCAHCAEYFSMEIPKKHFMNSLIMAFVSFVGQVSLTNIRINTIRILYEYCVANRYMSTESASELKEDGVFGKFEDMLGTSSATSTKSEKSLIDFDDGAPYGKASKRKEDNEDTDHDDSAMFEALDSLKASFKSGKYRFTVQDVTDDCDAYKDKYNKVAKKVETVNKLLIRRIKDIKTYNVGGKNSGMSAGRLDRKTIYRYKYDPNIFYNNTYKTLESDLAFGIILDESGSMSGSGIENGRITMVVLHETLKALGINHSIIGHTSDGKHHSDIYRYQAFQEDKTYKVCKNYAVVATEAKSGNCDSGALYYMEKALDRVRNKDKICLIFSDGAPTECTGTELKDQVRHMERKGIKVIGIGINFASIAKYYTDYANGRNLTDMLNIVAKILEEYVLKKKDK